MIERRNLLRLGLGLGASTVLPELAWAGRHGPARHGGPKHGPAAHAAAPARHCPPAEPVRTIARNGAPRSVFLRHLHTGEQLKAVYWEDGDYIPDALESISYVLRDFRTNEQHPIDRNLLDLLNDLRAVTGTKEPFRIISGYRSPLTNEMLREQSAQNHGQVPEVAKKSLHMEGQAVDIRLIDVALTRLHTTAMSLKRGGVGFYPDSDFIHVDVGAVRYWQGT